MSSLAVSQYRYVDKGRIISAHSATSSDSDAPDTKSDCETTMSESGHDKGIEGLAETARKSAARALAQFAANPATLTISGGLVDSIISRFYPSQVEHKRTEYLETQLKLLQNLSTLGVDPLLFDLFVSNELDRKLKQTFGFCFFAATLAFTVASYAIIVCNGIYSWRISELAINALIVETPLQFIGLLYIIARNLFPQSSSRRIGPVEDEQEGTRWRNTGSPRAKAPDQAPAT